MGRHYSDGAFAPAPFRPFARATIAGTWGTPTLSGDDSLTIDGFTYSIPELSVVKVVHSTVGQIVHVKVGRSVYVLHRGKQLVESEDEAKSRAVPQAWQAVSNAAS